MKYKSEASANKGDGGRNKGDWPERRAEESISVKKHLSGHVGCSLEICSVQNKWLQ